jgi:hypothetical protein
MCDVEGPTACGYVQLFTPTDIMYDIISYDMMTVLCHSFLAWADEAEAMEHPLCKHGRTCALTSPLGGDKYFACGFHNTESSCGFAVLLSSLRKPIAVATAKGSSSLPLPVLTAKENVAPSNVAAKTAAIATGPTTISTTKSSSGASSLPDPPSSVALQPGDETLLHMPLAHIDELLRNQLRILSNTSVVANLPDKGAQIQKKIEQYQRLRGWWMSQNNGAAPVVQPPVLSRVRPMTLEESFANLSVSSSSSAADIAGVTTGYQPAQIGTQRSLMGKGLVVSESEITALYQSLNNQTESKTIATPSSLKTTLMPHQCFGLSWMVEREGGLPTADDLKPFTKAKAAKKKKKKADSSDDESSEDDEASASSEEEEEEDSDDDAPKAKAKSKAKAKAKGKTSAKAEAKATTTATTTSSSTTSDVKTDSTSTATTSSDTKAITLRGGIIGDDMGRTLTTAF